MILRPQDETPAIAAQQQYLSSRLERLGRIISASQTEQIGQGYETSEVGNYPAGSLYDVSAGSTVPPTGSSFTQFDYSAASSSGAPLSRFEDPGYLLLSSQSKARYVSPAYFAMISQEVRTIWVDGKENDTDTPQVSEIDELLRSQQRYSLNPVEYDDDSGEEQDPPDPTQQVRSGLEDMQVKISWI